MLLDVHIGLLPTYIAAEKVLLIVKVRKSFHIFYAFRHTILLFCRDLEYDYQRLAWIGLYSGIIGYFLGMFGGFQPIFWDLSGAGAGIASRLFPTAISQRRRLIKRGLLPQ